MKTHKGYKTGEGETEYVEKSAYDKLEFYIKNADVTLAKILDENEQLKDLNEKWSIECERTRRQSQTIYNTYEARIKTLINVLEKLKHTYDIDLIKDTLNKTDEDDPSPFCIACGKP